MPKPGPRTTYRYTDEFKSTAVRLSALASVEVQEVAGDAAVLSDEAIGRILAYQYEPPALSRIASMPFGRELWSEWSEELSFATDQLEQDVIDTLMASPKVYDVSFLPSILIPE